MHAIMKAKFNRAVDGKEFLDDSSLPLAKYIDVFAILLLLVATDNLFLIPADGLLWSYWNRDSFADFSSGV